MMDDDYRDYDLLDAMQQAKWERQQHARRMALPPGHPDEPDDEGEE